MNDGDDIDNFDEDNDLGDDNFYEEDSNEWVEKEEEEKKEDDWLVLQWRSNII